MKTAAKKEKVVLSGCIILNNKNEILLLYRKDHGYYETPGGKIKPEECDDVEKPSVEELRNAAERELHEELGDDIVVLPLEYFGALNFIIPDGRKAVANKFVTSILKGKPRINEPETFSKLSYSPIETLEDQAISPDLKLFIPKLKEYIRTKKI